MRSNRLPILALIAVIVVTTVMTVLQLITPVPFSADGISASRTRLPLAGSCFDLTWNTGAESVTIDGAIVESAGTQSFCTWHDHTYTLSVGDSSVSIPISVVTASPLFWLIAMTPLFCLVALIQWVFPKVFKPHPPTPSPNGEGETSAASGGEAQRITVNEIAIVAVAFFALVIMLWIPFGLGGNASVDNWEYRGWFESDAFPVLNAPVSPHRPFAYINDGLNYLLTPDSFVTLNVLLIIYLVTKALLVYTLLRRLFPTHRLLALAVAILFTLHPVDPFYIGGIGVQTTLIFWLIAAHLLLSYWRRPSLITFGAAQLFAILSLSIYEVLIPLTLLLPLILLVDTPRLSRRWFVVALMWGILPSVWTLYFVIWLVSSPSPYFSRATEVATGGISAPRALVQVYAVSLFARYDDVARSFLAALRSMNSRLIYGAVGAIVTLLLSWFFGRQDAPLPFRRAILLIAAGLAIIFLGVVVYMPSNLFPTYAYFLTHPYFAANLGAALIIGTVIALLPRRLLQIGALTLFVGLIIPYLITQHRSSQNNTGDTARTILPIVRIMPEIEAGTDILVFDENRRITQNTFQYVLDAGLRTVYGTGDIRARFCTVRVDDITQAPDDATISWCIFTPDGVDVSGYDEFRDVPAYAFYRGDREVMRYDNLVIINVNDAGVGVLPVLPAEWGIDTNVYQPLERINFDAPPPRRYATMLEACNCLGD